MTQALVKFALKVAFVEKEKIEIAAADKRIKMNNEGKISVDLLSPQERTTKHLGENHIETGRN